MKVVVVNPGKKPTVEEIDNNLESMQQAVGGYIEVLHLFSDERICLVCNEEGKFLSEMKPNRAIFEEDRFKDMNRKRNIQKEKILDIIFGPFFLCSDDGDEFGPLSDRKIKEALKRFESVEIFGASMNKYRKR